MNDSKGKLMRFDASLKDNFDDKSGVSICLVTYTYDDVMLVVDRRQR